MKKQFVTHRVVCAQTLNVTLQLRVNNKLDFLSVAGVGYQPGESVIFAAVDELPLVVFSLCQANKSKDNLYIYFIFFMAAIYLHVYAPKLRHHIT